MILIIIIIIILIGIAFFAFYNKNSFQTLTGGYTSAEDLIPKWFPNVITLTNRVVRTFPTSSFVWLEKTDGLRQFIVLNDNKMFLIKDDKTLLFLQPAACEKFTLFDTEFYDNNYYIFDCVFLNGFPIHRYDYLYRIRKAYSKFSDKFQFKRWYRLESWKKVYDFILKYKHSPRTNQKIDGAIIQDITSPYFKQKTYKFKRKSLNTIDFLVRYNQNRSVFNLFLIAKDFQHVLRQVPQPSSLTDGAYIEFQTPFFNSMNEYDPHTKWSPPDDLFADEIKEISDLTNQVAKAPNDYDGKIFELGYGSKGWFLFRIREDKQRSNAYATGFANASIIFSPITFDSDVYFAASSYQKRVNFSVEIIDAFHAFSSKAREVVFREFALELPSTVVDLACGRGGDLSHLIKKGFKNIFAVDCDKEALVQYCERASRQNNGVTLNVFAYTLGEDNEELFREIVARKEWPEDGRADLVLMNFAVHYLCDSEQKIIALEKLATKLLKLNGLLVITYYDGDEIQRDITIKYKRNVAAGDTLTLKNFTITVTAVSKTITCLMPLPTIDSSGYREEPIALEYFLIYLQKNNFSLINELNIFSKYKDEMNSIPNIHKIDDYIKYIKTIVLKKKV
jgi:SAM-dependent methyltransferase